MWAEYSLFLCLELPYGLGEPHATVFCAFRSLRVMEWHWVSERGHLCKIERVICQLGLRRVPLGQTCRARAVPVLSGRSVAGRYSRAQDVGLADTNRRARNFLQKTP